MKRRDFMRTALGTAAVAGVASGSRGQNAPSNTVRVAVMGCHAKGRGFSLMKTLAGLPGVEIVTVCDVDARALDDAAAEVLKREEGRAG